MATVIRHSRFTFPLHTYTHSFLRFMSVMRFRSEYTNSGSSTPVSPPLRIAFLKHHHFTFTTSHSPLHIHNITSSPLLSFLHSPLHINLSCSPHDRLDLPPPQPSSTPSTTSPSHIPPPLPSPRTYSWPISNPPSACSRSRASEHVYRGPTAISGALIFLYSDSIAYSYSTRQHS